MLGTQAVLALWELLALTSPGLFQALEQGVSRVL